MTDGCKQVLFLCTGNYYRSRFAEELFNHLAEQEDLPWRAFSRGAAERRAPENTGSISRFALEALQALGISPRRADELPQPCTLADFRQADIVIGLKEAEHRWMVERRFPAVADRVLYWQVDDLDVAEPCDALPHVQQLVTNLIGVLRMDDPQS
ncbi:low molecular weight phosphatase family protein [Bradyrhizobium sp. MOS003]|jgi:protein-tyrosine phosphatase|uniref:arsenate-mycothiol transferase ArsC n=1 Tax=Bradyrhizobium sp. MOS003 TaxID=2133946 RepID=UPI000D13D80B|nr:low molecular weight phosphatase family protein [Bradyrhizobium sp. MOS003]PSO15027.1 low molecular weight phosphatase family protein [Bradyrhizobium sp. MOS003]